MRKKQTNKRDVSGSYISLQSSKSRKLISFESNLKKEKFNDFQKELSGNYDDVVLKIDKLVNSIALLISTLPSTLLLHRAWGEMLTRLITMKSEAEGTMEDALSIRMIEYVQSVIVSVTPSPNKKETLSDENWTTLKLYISTLFDLINSEYHICHTAKRRLENPNLDMAEEDLYFEAQLYWCNVRGTRYLCHQKEHFLDILSPHSQVFEYIFGITTDDFILEILKISDSLTFGLGKAAQEIEELRIKSLSALDEEIKNPSFSHEDKKLEEVLMALIEKNGWLEWKKDMFNRFNGLGLFDLLKITNLPVKLLDELSWSEGEDKEFFKDGEFKGWPLRIWPVSKRPFLKIKDHYYCFELSSLFDNLYRILQHIILRYQPQYQSEWNEKQKTISEELPFKYFTRLLPNAKQYKSVYYRSDVGTKGQRGWCETDGIIIYDNHLFIIEVKAGAFTYTSPSNDFDAYKKSIKNLVLAPSKQGERFLEYLYSEESVYLYDENHKKIAKISHHDFQKVTICPIILDGFTEITSQSQYIKGTNFDVWPVSIDDLRVYSEIFNNPLIFLHFVEQRMEATSSSIIKINDEFDHLGMYIKHNHYSLYADQVAKNFKNTSNFFFFGMGYKAEVDSYFTNKIISPDLPSPIKQIMPERLMEIINLLSLSEEIGKVRVSSQLLDLGGEFRDKIINKINLILSEKKYIRGVHPISIHGGHALTVFCWQEPYITRNISSVLENSRAIMLISKEQERLALELFYSEDDKLIAVKWQFVSLEGLSQAELDYLTSLATNLKASRCAKVGKIGRNDSCPCGSGKKHKKCCLP